MKIEINDTQFVDTIVEKLFEKIKPLLNHERKTDDRLMDVKGLADYLQVKESWIYEKIHNRQIPYHKCGKFPRFRKKYIDIWLKNPYSSELDNFNLNRGVKCQKNIK
jgi:excisionase family DNA binding protein